MTHVVCVDCFEAPGVLLLYREGVVEWVVDGVVLEVEMNEGRIHDFSRQTCAVCGSTLGGWRWECEIREG